MLDRVDTCQYRRLDAVRAVRVGRCCAASFVRFFDACAQLVERELLRARLNASGHDAASGDELDAVGARFELLADGLADVVRTVRLAPDPGAVTAGHTDDH